MKADALVGLITGPHAEGRAVGAEVTVLIDLDTLRNGLHPDSVCETGDGQPLPPESVRRLCCDAEIIPAVLGGGGELLDVGRSQRVANRAQRRAVHEGGWTLVLHADRTITLRRPDGTIHDHGSTIDVAPVDLQDEPPGRTISELADLARQRVRALGPPGRTTAA